LSDFCSALGKRDYDCLVTVLKDPQAVFSTVDSTMRTFEKFFDPLRLQENIGANHGQSEQDLMHRQGPAGAKWRTDQLSPIPVRYRCESGPGGDLAPMTPMMTESVARRKTSQ